jgi:hypothetical protein
MIDKTGKSGMASQPPVIKLHRVSFLVNFPNSKLLLFMSIVIIPNEQNHWPTLWIILAYPSASWMKHSFRC